MSSHTVKLLPATPNRRMSASEEKDAAAAMAASAAKTETFTVADIIGVSALELADRNKALKKKPAVKSPKTKAERNAIITAALAADPKRAAKIAEFSAASPTFAKAAKKGKITLAQSKKVAAEFIAGPKAPKAPKASKKKALPHKNDHGATGLPANAGGTDATSTLAGLVAADQILRKSSIKSPCQIVWETASEMKGMVGFARKDVIASCMEKGVAYYTARTQYQQWKAAGDNDARTAAKSK